MKKLVLSLFLIFSYFQGNSQVTRSEYAEMVFDIIYESNNNPNNYVASNYPNPFIDINQNTTLGKKIIILSYLEWGGGISVINRSQSFSPNAYEIKGESIKILLEGYNVPIATSNVSPFNNLFPGDSYYDYFYTAWSLGMISGGNVYPFQSLSFSDAQNNITWALNSAWHPVTNSDLMQMSNYFTPNSFEPNNIGFLRGLEQGVFSHYAKDSFVIPDRKFNLNFSHYYSTQLVEIPEEYFPVQPLGRGWTHTYNSYITRKDNVIGSDDLYYIKWADGSIQIYNQDEDEYITKGVYDEFNEFDNGDNIEITTKNQTHYYFERLDNSEQVFYLYKIEDKNGNEVNIEYETSQVNNDYKRIEWVEAPSGKKLNFYYHPNTDFISHITDPINRQISFLYNEERLKYFYDAKNQETKYYYVSNDEDAPDEHQYKRFLLKKIRLPKGNKIEAEYDNNNDGKLEQYKINDNEPIAIDIDFNYENTDPVTAHLQIPMPNGGIQDYDYQFDANGMVTHFENNTQNININYPNPTDVNSLLPNNIDVNGLDIDYNYDNKGNVTSIQVETNDDEDFWYDSDNNLIHHRDENGNDTYFNYDSNNNLTSIEDALGNLIHFTYDNYGQVLSVTNQEGITVNYTYETDGAVSTISAPENLTSSFTYDGINRLLQQTINGQTSSFIYDPNDNLISQTNIGGLTTVFDYDANDNIITITNANGVETNFGYNTKDQVISESFNGLTKQYEYNDDGSLDKFIKPSGDIVQYDYLSNGKLNEAGTITDIDYYGSSGGKKKGLIESIESESIRYNLDYDYLNRLDEVEINSTGQKVIYDYDNTGNIIKIIYPEAPNGLLDFEVRYQYDAKNRLTNLETEFNNTSMTIASYTYRDDDLISKINYGSGVETNYSYDNAGRLISISHEKTEPIFTETLEFDNHGNITNVDTGYKVVNNLPHFSPGIEEQSFSYDDTNRLQSPYEVNDDGNLINTGTGTSYTYDIDDQLSQKNSNEGTNHFEYDPYGNRTFQQITDNTGNYETQYVWDIINKNIIQEVTAGSNVKSYHIYGLGLEATVSSNGTIRFYHGDTRGNVVSMSQLGNSIYNKTYIYDDFGNVKLLDIGHLPDNNKFTFLGKYGIVEDDREQGLYYIRARYYDAKLGRFLTQDPIWSTNLYPYADNNPISNIDINGKNWENFSEQALDIIGNFLWNDALLMYSKDQKEKIYQNLKFFAEGGFYGTKQVDKLNKEFEDLYVQIYINERKFNNSAMLGLAITSLWTSDNYLDTLGAITLNVSSLKNAKKATKFFGKTGYIKVLDMRTLAGIQLKEITRIMSIYATTINKIKKQ